jgi:hypothetical protein
MGSVLDGVTGIFHWHNPSDRNKYQEYSLGSRGGWSIGLTTLKPSCANCLEIWEPQIVLLFSLVKI